MLEAETEESKISTVDVTEGKSQTSVMSKFGFVIGILFLILFVPSPIYICVDGCGASSVIPFALALTSIISLSVLLNPIIWLVHFIFVIPFVLGFMGINKIFKQRIWWWVIVRFVMKVLLFILLWIFLAKAWGLIPAHIIEGLLGLQG
jgi:hypothetical protein